jgi:hypothetical protein
VNTLAQNNMNFKLALENGATKLRVTGEKLSTFGP